jgi:hypothetical protein
MDPLFPELPEDLSVVSDEDLASLLAEHEAAAELIDAEDEDFIKGMEADDVLAAYEAGVEQIEAIRAEQENRIKAQEEYLSKKAALSERRKAEAAEAAEEEEEGDEEEEEVAEELQVAEVEAVEEEEVETVEEKELEPVVASGEKKEEESKPEERKPLRRPPAPAAERQLQTTGAVLTAAAGLQDVRGGQVLGRMGYANTVKLVGQRWGARTKSAHGVEEKMRVAGANFAFPDDRRLDAGDWEANAEKIRQVIPDAIPGVFGNKALTASGGLCAPLEPIYSMPNFASMARPVRDALPSFQAERGGVNVPAATSIGDITSAITVIEESEDALGGTYATKSCQDMSCPSYTEVPVTIISHCREYGNLNARAWPEKIAHENDLTMAAHARAAEGYLLDRIKALSINVTQAEMLGAFADLVHALTKAQAGIRYRLRMNQGARFRVLMPYYVPDLLAADFAMTQFDRVQPQAAAAALLDRFNISVTYYLDPVTGGTSQAFADEAAGTLDDYPDDIQWAIFPEGQFIHVDSGVLELGIVRDSTLNSTNDFQLFGESFENVAMLGPAQGALWVTQGICPSGEFPALGTALSC